MNECKWLHVVTTLIQIYGDQEIPGAEVGFVVGSKQKHIAKSMVDFNAYQ